MMQKKLFDLPRARAPVVSAERHGRAHGGLQIHPDLAGIKPTYKTSCRFQDL
jgi:hypothetical protein